MCGALEDSTELMSTGQPRAPVVLSPRTGPAAATDGPVGQSVVLQQALAGPQGTMVGLAEVREHALLGQRAVDQALSLAVVTRAEAAGIVVVNKGTLRINRLRCEIPREAAPGPPLFGQACSIVQQEMRPKS
jgi:hypothetical protein